MFSPSSNSALSNSIVFDIDMKFAGDENIILFFNRNHIVSQVIEDLEMYGHGWHVFFCTFDLLLTVMVALQQCKYPILLFMSIVEIESILLFMNHDIAVISKHRYELEFLNM
jgi:hypothetical protein